MNVSSVFEYQWEEPTHCFASFVCDRCGEMTVAPYGRNVQGKHVCIPCSQAMLSDVIAK